MPAKAWVQALLPGPAARRRAVPALRTWFAVPVTPARFGGPPNRRTQCINPPPGAKGENSAVFLIFWPTFPAGSLGWGVPADVGGSSLGNAGWA